MCFIQATDLESARHEALSALLRIVRTSTSETQVRLAAAAILRLKPDPAEIAAPEAKAAAPPPARTAPVAVAASGARAIVTTASTSDIDRPNAAAASHQARFSRPNFTPHRVPARSRSPAAAILANSGCPPSACHAP
ncbi:MAG: hypothetical protein IT438_05850 [Phycisphaerales bacterium]|nr:hypothetical protein [Phycisphaerales bacterium]